MAVCIEKMPHAECGSSDGCQVWLNEDESYSAFCFACETYVPDPYGDGETPAPRKTRDENTIRAEMDFISTLPSLAVESRSIKQYVMEHYHVKVGLSEVDGCTVAKVHFPICKDGSLFSYKTRNLLAKDFWWVKAKPKGHRVQLFGWNQAVGSGRPTLFITEGELDALSLYQALKDSAKGSQYADLNPAVVSVTCGASKAKDEIAAWAHEINTTFKKVVLVFDEDTAGRKAREEVLKVLPNAEVATLPCKDANACIMEGKTKALVSAVLFNSSKAKNTRLKLATDFSAQGREPPQYGLSWPWKHLTKLTRGVRWGETIYIGSGVKMGKSEVVNTLAAHYMIKENQPVFLAKPEEPPHKTLQMVSGKIEGKFFHDPDREFDYEAYDRACDKIGDKLLLLDLYQHLTWPILKGDILAAATMGHKIVIIDPITNLTNGINPAEANTLLQEIAQDLAAMAKDFPLIVFLFCHLNAPQAGEPHELGGRVMSVQFAGSRAMMRSCHVMLGLEGNRSDNLSPAQRNCRDLVLLEHREFGAAGRQHLYWDENTGLFNEVE